MLPSNQQLYDEEAGAVVAAERQQATQQQHRDHANIHLNLMRDDTEDFLKPPQPAVAVHAAPDEQRNRRGSSSAELRQRHLSVPPSPQISSRANRRESRVGGGGLAFSLASPRRLSRQNSLLANRSKITASGQYSSCHSRTARLQSALCRL